MWVNDIIDRIKLPFRKEKELFSALYDILGFYPHDIELYKQALLHKSVGKRNEKGRPQNNERLEFLGDAILDAVVGHIVFRHFEGKREGFLTNTRSKLVSRATLGKISQEMGIPQLIDYVCRSFHFTQFLHEWQCLRSPCGSDLSRQRLRCLHAIYGEAHSRPAHQYRQSSL